MKKVKYIIRKRALGDVLWIEPVIRAYSTQYDQVIVHTKYNELFENYPSSNVIFKKEISVWERLLINIEKRAGSHFFTLNLDNTYEKSPELHPLNAYQQKAGLPLTREYSKIYLSDSEMKHRSMEERYIILHAESFSNKKYRELIGIEWNKVINYLKGEGYKVIQTGSKDMKFPDAAYFKTSIRELISMIYHADFFIGIDSGPSHIASSLSVPSLIVFGALKPSLRHFPEKFDGILLKQQCNRNCNNIIIDEEDHNCSLVNKNENPPCCIFSTETVLSAVEALIKRNVLSKNYQ